MKIAMIGTGYVGLVTGTCFASKGHNVICVDVIEDKIKKINEGIAPIFEEGLDEMLQTMVSKGSIKATLNMSEAIAESELIYICVGTPTREDGAYDYTFLKDATQKIGEELSKTDQYKVIAVKSTCSPGTTVNLVKPILEETSQKIAGKDFGLGMNPEFLREGVAIRDFLEPDRIVIGGIDKKSQEMIGKSYKDLDSPILYVDPTSAEMIKIAANSFLAMKISFINELANISEKIGTDIIDIAKGIGMDDRISDKFLRAGLGYGGSCITGDDFILLGNSTPEIATSKELYEKFQFNKNIQAISFDGQKSKLEEVRHFTKRKYKGKILTFHTKMGRKISVTEDHPMLVEKDGNLEVKLAFDIKVNDKLPVLTDYPIDRKDKLNVYEIVKGNVDFLKFRPIKHDLKMFKEDLYPIITPIQESDWKIYDLIRRNYLNLQIFEFLIENNHLPLNLENYYIYTTQGTPTYVPSIINLDADFWRLIGYYLAEGHISYDKGERGVRARVGFSFNKNENEFISDVCNILDKLEIRYSVNTRDQVSQIVVSSRIFAYVLEKYLKCGKDSYTKRLPALIYTESKESKINLLKGLFRGDGNVYFHKHAVAITIEYGTVSEELAEGVIALLQSLNIIPSYKQRWMKKSTRPAHIVRISGHRQVKEMKLFDSGTNIKITKTLKKQKRIIKPLGYEKFSGFASLRIKDIVVKDQDIDVYSIEMKRAPHTFISTSGFIIHNCFPKDIRALHHQSVEMSVPSDLLKATMQVNEAQPFRAAEILTEEMEDRSLEDKKIAILGLAFKPDTDDVREAVSITLINHLLDKGAKVFATDPKAINNFKEIINHENLTLSNKIEDILNGADACILVTEWKEYLELTPELFKKHMKNPLLIDGRRTLDYEKFREKGIIFRSIGLGK